MKCKKFIHLCKALTSGTQKSGTHERTPKSGSEAGAPLLLSKERESGAALNFFRTEDLECFWVFNTKSAKIVLNFT